MSNGRGRNGAQQNVQRALGWQSNIAANRSQIASCTFCGAELRFGTGEYGQTLEQCSNGSCPNHRPHPPRPDPADLKAPYVPKKRRDKRREEE